MILNFLNFQPEEFFIKKINSLIYFYRNFIDS